MRPTSNSAQRHAAAQTVAVRGEMAQAQADRRAARVGIRATVTIALLALLAAMLGAVSAACGPQLRDISIDLAAASTSPRQRLLIRTDQLLAPVTEADVRIEPTAAAQVSVVDNTVVVEFSRALASGTEYRVSFAAVGERTGHTTEIKTSFTTPPAALTMLRRDDKGFDTVVQAEIGADGAAEQTLLAAPRLQEYAVAGTKVIAVSLDAAGRGTLVESTGAGGFQARADAPRAQRYRTLRGNLEGTALGFVADGGNDDENGRLYLIDAETNELFEVENLGGTHSAVVEWSFVPGTRAVLVQAANRQATLVDPIGGRVPVPLGEYDTILGFFADETSVLLQTASEFTRINLRTGERTPIEVPDAVADPAASEGQLLPLTNDLYVRQFQTVDNAAGVQRTQLYRLSASDATLLAAPEDDWIGNVCRSPNAEFLALLRVPDHSSIDSYPLQPGFIGSQLEIVRVDDGSSVATFDGLQANWCGW